MKHYGVWIFGKEEGGLEHENISVRAGWDGVSSFYWGFRFDESYWYLEIPLLWEVWFLWVWERKRDWRGGELEHENITRYPLYDVVLFTS